MITTEIEPTTEEFSCDFERPSFDSMQIIENKTGSPVFIDGYIDQFETFSITTINESIFKTIKPKLEELLKLKLTPIKKKVCYFQDDHKTLLLILDGKTKNSITFSDGKLSNSTICHQKFLQRSYESNKLCIYFQLFSDGNVEVCDPNFIIIHGKGFNTNDVLTLNDIIVHRTPLQTIEIPMEPVNNISADSSGGSGKSSDGNSKVISTSENASNDELVKQMMALDSRISTNIQALSDALIKFMTTSNDKINTLITKNKELEVKVTSIQTEMKTQMERLSCENKELQDKLTSIQTSFNKRFQELSQADVELSSDIFSLKAKSKKRSKTLLTENQLLTDKFTKFQTETKNQLNSLMSENRTVDRSIKDKVEGLKQFTKTSFNQLLNKNQELDKKLSSFQAEFIKGLTKLNPDMFKSSTVEPKSTTEVKVEDKEEKTKEPLVTNPSPISTDEEEEELEIEITIPDKPPEDPEMVKCNTRIPKPDHLTDGEYKDVMRWIFKCVPDRSRFDKFRQDYYYVEYAIVWQYKICLEGISKTDFKSYIKRNLNPKFPLNCSIDEQLKKYGMVEKQQGKRRVQVLIMQ